MSTSCFVEGLLCVVDSLFLVSVFFSCSLVGLGILKLCVV
jgi:hypothetical protein